MGFLATAGRGSSGVQGAFGQVHQRVVEAFAVVAFVVVGGVGGVGAGERGQAGAHNFGEA